MNYLDTAYTVFEGEIKGLEQSKEALDDNYNQFVYELDRCRGTLIWTGIGKSGHICKKIVATMQSLGIKSFYLHPSEALHGDLGLISSDDIVIAVSNSGETKELVDTIIPIRNLGAKVLAIVGHKDSSLEKMSDRTLVIGISNEVYLDLVPTTSTTTMLVLGDAIAVSIAQKRKFTKEDFGKYHPNGQLGMRLTFHVSDIMLSGTEHSIVLEGSSLEQVIFEMCRKPVGCVNIVDRKGMLVGLFTDGDLRRYLNNGGSDLKTTIVDTLMVTNPIILHPDQLLFDAIVEVISKHSVSVYPVVDSEGKSVGTLRTIDVIKSGLIS